jgi:antitoxin VapB
MTFQITKINKEKGSQAIILPKQMNIDDDRVYLKKVGNALLIIPYHRPWQNLFDSLDNFTADYLDDRAKPNNRS